MNDKLESVRRNTNGRIRETVYDPEYFSRQVGKGDSVENPYGGETVIDETLDDLGIYVAEGHNPKFVLINDIVVEMDFESDENKRLLGLVKLHGEKAGTSEYVIDKIKKWAEDRGFTFSNTLK